MREAKLSKLLMVATISLCTQILAHQAMAEDYPTRQVRLVTGSAPGGGGDFMTRLIAQELSEIWGQPVIVENLPGASQSIATGTVARSTADGYTLAFITSSILATALNPNPSYDLERDVVPIGMVAVGPVLVAVNSSMPIYSVKDLIDVARSQPGKLNFASGGIGTTAHLTGELFNELAGLDLVHVPYASTEQAVVSTASGETQMVFPGFGGTLPLVQAGKLRLIAVAGEKRSALMPELPTVNETLPGFDEASWYGMFAPKDVPQDILAQIVTAVRTAANSPEVVEKLATLGFEPQPLTPDEFATKLHNDLARYIQLANKIGLKPQ